VNEHHEPVPYQGNHHTYLLEGKHIVALDAVGKADETAGILDLSITQQRGLAAAEPSTFLLVMFISVARGYKRRPKARRPRACRASWSR
jgi:hypothetical protein